jgi:hypothetical protein
MYQYNNSGDADQAGRPQELKKTTDYYGALYAGNLVNQWFVEDAGYVRLREISLRYRVPETVLSRLPRIGVDGLTVFASAATCSPGATTRDSTRKPAHRSRGWTTSSTRSSAQLPPVSRSGSRRERRNYANTEGSRPLDRAARRLRRPGRYEPERARPRESAGYAAGRADTHLHVVRRRTSTTRSRPTPACPRPPWRTTRRVASSTSACST